MKIKKEFNFILPQEVLDDTGKSQKIKGVMRLVRVKDLVDIHLDTRVKESSSYFYVVLLSKVIKKLGNEKFINTRIIENLSISNFAFLIDFLNEINHSILASFPVTCNECGHTFTGGVHLVGEL